MVIESIHLHNFRQFKNVSIDFALGQDGRNVTVVLGENGTGKTTLAQAFSWCLYGEVGFSDKNLLNNVVASKASPGKDLDVSVKLSLKQGNVEYEISRQQTYLKIKDNDFKPGNTMLYITRKGESGNSDDIKNPLQCEEEINSILPKELSTYFFFDGERIEKMSKDISSDRKSTDFAEAVKGLLGLNGLKSAIDHLNPKSKNGVIKSFINSLNSASDTKLKEKKDLLDKYDEEIENIQKNLESYEEECETAQQIKSDSEKSVKLYEEAKELQNEKERYEESINKYENGKSMFYKVISDKFNDSMDSFFSVPLVKKALELLTDVNISGKDIPHMHADTIEHLINRKVCICGTQLEEGSVAYKNVKELEEYLPPKSISTTVSDFKNEARRRIKEYDSKDDIISSIEGTLAQISHFDDSIIEARDKVQSIDRKLRSGDFGNKVSDLQNLIEACNKRINEATKKRLEFAEELGRKKSERERVNTEIQDLATKDRHNREIKKYILYANQIFDDLSSIYKAKEDKVRNQLQNNINEIFKKMFEGSLSISVDENYHISVNAKDYGYDIGDVETSTAQSIAVIFAFITGIIKMARENQAGSSEDDFNLLASEPYPLVMDAPLSSFDKQRIKAVCEILPSIAEQVIIFIKDTDGNIAMDNMGNRIGGLFWFERVSEFETEIKA